MYVKSLQGCAHAGRRGAAVLNAAQHKQDFKHFRPVLFGMIYLANFTIIKIWVNSWHRGYRHSRIKLTLFAIQSYSRFQKISSKVFVCEGKSG